MGREKRARPLSPVSGLRKLPIGVAERRAFWSATVRGPSASPFPLAITSSKLLLLCVCPLSGYWWYQVLELGTSHSFEVALG